MRTKIINLLNKWRNTEKYGVDKFAPANYSFDYLFATAMAGQPLAWFEGSNLPEEAFGIKRLINGYKKLQHDFHSGVILPIGNEPSGKSWTGFQSINGKTGYLLIFREKTTESSAFISAWFSKGDKVKCKLLLGNNGSTIASVYDGRGIEVSIPKENDFVLFEYEIE